MSRMLLLMFLIGLGHQVNAGAVSGEFPSIDGGTISLEDWRGGPVLVVNTASRCGFTHQYDDLQALYDRYRTRGFEILAVPSNDFKQELSSAEQVKDFCEINFDLDLPMTDITHVRGSKAHPFYKEVREKTGFVPRWNFNKILLDSKGEVVKTWGARVNPTSQKITGEIEALLQSSPKEAASNP
ncbi:glutathione peroxidase [Aliiruegeria sabulilitoris]|uniref:glutathione peroxidase n=1 Tax=Aliiruegeria sabulilitoris TaxID=1510458 RepID=UPI00083507B8|nr:glutathione peroxidase [Aliiruegeria sabulilitoris]NDR59264.1 glutathione peroxidase [Pseudoruegeria sp. M32A2M]